MSSYSELVHWLTFIYESGLKLQVIKPIIQQWCVTDQRPLAELFTLSPLDWATTFGLTPNEIAPLQDLATQLPTQAKQLEQWQQQGLEPLIFTDPRYPQRLLHQLPLAKQPLILWVQGAVSLLNEANVSILSNLNPPSSLHSWLETVTQQLSHHHITLVSGYGRGFERDLFDRMHQHPESHIITILPMGLSAFHQTTPKLAHAHQADNLLLVSPFAPHTPYQEKLATARNLLIDHLAFATLAVQPDHEIQERAQAILEQGGTVFVYSTTETAAVQALIETGAISLTDLNELLEMVQQSMIDALMLTPDPSLTPSLAWPEAATDSYSLTEAPLDPLDPQHTLQILAAQGQLPNVLRERLS